MKTQIMAPRAHFAGFWNSRSANLPKFAALRLPQTDPHADLSFNPLRRAVTTAYPLALDVKKTNIKLVQNRSATNFEINLEEEVVKSGKRMLNSQEQIFKSSGKRRVAVILDSSNMCSREILSGISKYTCETDRWSVSLCGPDFQSSLLKQLKKWPCEGLLVHSANHVLTKRIRELKLPAVFVQFSPRVQSASSVGIDNSEISRLCFEHLKACGFNHFAFYSIRDKEEHKNRRECFQRMVIKNDLKCHVYPHKRPFSRLKENLYNGLGIKDKGQVAEWLKELPKPIGIMASDDRSGQRILDAARALGLIVPNDVAVIGVGNDETFCNLCSPALSSVFLNTERIGYEAAFLLSKIMAGRRNMVRRIVAKPAGIVIRSSTMAITAAGEKP
jgi:LacI family transcriptional regulator